MNLFNGKQVIVKPAAMLFNEPFLATVKGIAANPVAVIGHCVMIEVPDYVRAELVKYGQDWAVYPAFEVHLQEV
jgi:hypothetical protein